MIRQGLARSFTEIVGVNPPARAAANDSTAAGFPCAWPWALPSETLDLQHDEVHVWVADLNHSAFPARDIDRILSSEERERAARFYFDRDRNHFIGSRAILRLILGRYIDMPPGQVQFSRGPHGKPALATERGADALYFNIAHSHDVALCGVTRGRDIGVDVERVNADVNVDLIAERFFSRREIAALRLLPPERKLTAFFTCWVRKEAYLKARGDGFSMALDSFSVSVSPGEPASLLDVTGHPEEAVGWSLSELDVAPSYTAALAVRGGECPVRCWQLTADTPDRQAS